MIAAVIGSPIAHSLSPKLFGFIAENEGVEMDYQAHEVSLNDSKNFLEQIKNNKDYIGLNVTIPLKETFLTQVDELSSEVKIIGALNVLHFKDDKIWGHNTDVIGIERTLREKRFDVTNKACAILGAGGAAKAMAYVLGNEKAKIVYVYSLSSKNNELVLNFRKHFPETSWVAINASSPELNNHLCLDLIVNTTPLGMTGKESGSEFFKVVDQFKFNEEALAFDLIYTPSETEFIKKCKSLSIKSVGGLGMLIYQALGTWSIWNGELANEAQMRADLAFFLSGILKLKGSEHSLFLTGFMGVGKTHVGKNLAKLLNFKWLDTDELIEKKLGESVTEIFKKEGEAFFRGKESECIQELCEDKKLIVSLGGGALMKRENVDVILKANHTKLIYLKASFESLLLRINRHEKDSKVTRPILMNLNQEEKLTKMKELFKIREESYKRASLQIDTDQMNAMKVAYKIIMSIGEEAV